MLALQWLPLSLSLFAGRDHSFEENYSAYKLLFLKTLPSWAMIVRVEKCLKHFSVIPND
jgi:hypothetical protein